MMSYLWLFDELLAIMGMTGMALSRIDHCTCGTPYQKPQLWLSSNPEMLAEGSVRTHPNNLHSENISGGHKARRTAPYPDDLCVKLTNAFGRLYTNGQGRVDPNLKKIACYLKYQLYGPGDRKKWTTDSAFVQQLMEAGRLMLQRLRSGGTAVSAVSALKSIAEAGKEPLVDGSAAGPAAPKDAAGILKGVSPNAAEFERRLIFQLQQADPEYADIIKALELRATMTKDAGDKPVEEEALFKAVKKALDCPDAERAKRAHCAIRESRNYALDNLLYRRVLDTHDNAMSVRVVVPNGGTSSFHYNGWRYRLPFKKKVLLLYHDSEHIGGHPGMRDTHAKIARYFWWPSLEADVRRWCSTCATRRVTKPTPSLAAP